MAKDLRNRVICVDPWYVKPLHGIQDEIHFRTLSRSMMESGWKGRPLIAIPLGRGYYQAVTGSHRHAAAIEASLPRIPILPFDEKEMKVVLRSEGYDPDQERIFSPAIVSEALEKRGHKGIGNLLRMDVMTAIMEIQHPEAVPWSKEAIAYYKTTSFNDPAAIKVMAVETWPC